VRAGAAALGETGFPIRKHPYIELVCSVHRG
jgi:hypothetical protein